MTAPDSLSTRDRDRLRAVEHAVGQLDSAVHGGATMGALADLMETDIVTHWGISADAAQVRLRDVVVAGPRVPSAAYFRELAKGVESGEIGFLFTPNAPERAQRNRPVLVPGARSTLRLRRAESQRLGLSNPALGRLLPGLERIVELLERFHIADLYHLRTLICDGPEILCYLNALDERVPTRRQRRLFRHATTLLHRRLLLDKRLAAARIERAALDATLEALGRAAFLVDLRGAVLHANALGEDALDREDGLRAELRRATQGDAPSFDVVRLSVSGLPPHFLAMRRVAELGQFARALAGEYDLGRRATQVFALCAAGESTKSIATKLDLADNTVEYHLTQIFRRFGVSGRAGLHAMLLARLATRRA